MGKTTQDLARLGRGLAQPFDEAQADGIVIIEAGSGRMVALDRFNQVGWALQRGRLRALCQRWRPGVIWAEANSIGAVNIEAL